MLLPSVICRPIIQISVNIKQHRQQQNLNQKWNIWRSRRYAVLTSLTATLTAAAQHWRKIIICISNGHSDQLLLLFLGLGCFLYFFQWEREEKSLTTRTSKLVDSEQSRIHPCYCSSRSRCTKWEVNWCPVKRPFARSILIYDHYQNDFGVTVGQPNAHAHLMIIITTTTTTTDRPTGRRTTD